MVRKRKPGCLVHMLASSVWLSWCSLKCVVGDDPSGSQVLLGVLKVVFF